MNNEYVIINKTAIQQKIEELEKERQEHEKVHIKMFDSIWAAKTSQAIDLLREILSLSTPLIPEIEKAYDAGKLDMELSQTFDNPKGRYLSNLKLDI